ncbi:MAG: molybdenum-binding protein [Candidatus Brocadia sp.]|nr:LysR family transcriptional regulator [Candidatus Brocadia sp. AMX3]MDG5997681.1 LysR family transcriptional regulator [Candidatus Brocadia sp.]RIK00334.1 MAG: molybdenum-binding protein [Candidatus Brocadia sp.]
MRYNQSLIMNVRCKIWFEKDSSVAFAEGRRMLLEAVDRLGSLNAAAKELGMSYRAAWGKIKATEQVLGIKLLEVTTGGKGGGGATLTAEAKELISKYRKYTDKMTRAMEKEFQRIFQDKNS